MSQTSSHSARGYPSQAQVGSAPQIAGSAYKSARYMSRRNAPKIHAHCKNRSFFKHFQTICIVVTAQCSKPQPAHLQSSSHLTSSEAHLIYVGYLRASSSRPHAYEGNPHSHTSCPCRDDARVCIEGNPRSDLPSARPIASYIYI